MPPLSSVLGGPCRAPRSAATSRWRHALRTCQWCARGAGSTRSCHGPAQATLVTSMRPTAPARQGVQRCHGIQRRRVALPSAGGLDRARRSLRAMATTLLSARRRSTDSYAGRPSERRRRSRRPSDRKRASAIPRPARWGEMDLRRSLGARAGASGGNPALCANLTATLFRKAVATAEIGVASTGASPIGRFCWGLSRGPGSARPSTTSDQAFDQRVRGREQPYEGGLCGIEPISRGPWRRCATQL